MSFITILFSCTNDDDNQVFVNESWLLGSWDLINVKVNNVTDDASSCHILNFKNNGTYYRTYEHGNWKLNNNTIELDAMRDNDDRHLEIIRLTPNTLMVRMELTVNQYRRNFDEHNENEVLTISETYKRNN